MDKTYNPQIIESTLYQDWEAKHYFEPAGNGPGYCIMLPPPNVTGSLHMGHAFQHTLMDILIRYHRMSGDKTLWQCGTDHAGIATQMVVERQLEQQGISRHDLGRKKFVERVWAWKQESGSIITRQLRRLGTSMDWSRERFTMDEGLSKAVQKVFIDLYNEGLIYRGQRLVNWDPVLHTAISDLEVISEEESGHMWHIRYPIHNESGYLIVATTRPETMLGDAAVAVHPEDDRYKKFIGKRIDLPLTGRTIPVIADEYVDPEFGTGCVKITPAHDFNDYEVGQRHNLSLFNIFTRDAKIVSDIDWPDSQNNNKYGNVSSRNVIDMASDIGIPEAYRGLDRFVARKNIVADLETAGLLEKTELHKLVVPRGDRSGAVIEPYLTDQWYVKIAPLAKPAIKAVEDGKIKFIPENWSRTYFEWMRNIQDWCISRQLWWGHQIPAWYDEQGNIHVGESENEIRKREKLGKDVHLTQDEDVLDTWFSSALWPFSTLDWPEQSAEMRTFYPTSVLVTGFDIIFFWVARMIMLGLKFPGDVPFREVYVHGLVRDAEGQKMSKSKGNILDPLDLIDGIDLESLVKKRISGMMQPHLAEKIEKATRKHFPEGIAAYGTDSLRFTFASLATHGRDIRFDVGRIGGYRNFCNKLWNATRYVMMSTETQSIDIYNNEKDFGLAERWINTRLVQAIEEVTTAINTYRFDLATKALYEFTWDEYCDWYLELSKTTLNHPDASVALKRGTLYTLVNVLEILLRLLHPFIPFITEELWQRVAPVINKQAKTIMLQPYPATSEIESDYKTVEEINWVKSFILGVRRIRAERDIAPGKPLAVKIKGGNKTERKWLNNNSGIVQTLAKIDSIIEIEVAPPDAVMALAGDMNILVPLADLIDKETELAKIDKEIIKSRSEEISIRKKLEDEKFITRAPKEVVNKERERLEKAEKTTASLEEQFNWIKKL